MPLRFAVIGSGPLGTAAAYDLAVHGDADEVRILDLVIGRARRAAETVNRLTRRNVAKAGVVNAAEITEASQVLEGLDGCVSAVPSALHPVVARAAVRARVHYTDLGGAANAILSLHEEAKAASVSLIPDSGAAPGLANVMVAHGMRQMDAPHAVHVRAGDLPEDRSLPLSYQPHFSVEALATRYFGSVEQIVDGEFVAAPALSGLEAIEIPPIGTLEAFATPGGCDTCPRSYGSRLTRFDFKTLRYPGHHRAVSMLNELGFLSREPVNVDGHAVAPVRVFQSVMDRLWNQPEGPDIYVLRVEVVGTEQGRPARFVATLVDRPDQRIGLTATQRCTGFVAGAILVAQAAGRVPAGARAPERALTPTAVLEDLRRRGLRWSEEREPANGEA